MTKPFDKLVEIMARLRSENGCSWDREQSHETLKPFLIEEAYEVIDAIDSGDMAHLKDELGDLMLQVVFHAQMADEEAKFNIDDVCNSINEKLIRRHPHVFAESDAKTPDEVYKQWEEIKKTEKSHETRTSALDGTPRGLPSLIRAMKMQKKAASVGFDWDTADEAFAKVDEELHEFREAMAEGDAKHMEEELGDLLFALVNVGRFIEVNPEDALTKTIGKFRKRFMFVEEKISKSGRSMDEVSLEEMDKFWNEAKAKGDDL